MFLWILKQTRRIKRFFMLLPYMAADSNGYIALLKHVIHLTLIYGIHGLKSYCHSVVASHQHVLRLNQPDGKLEPRTDQGEQPRFSSDEKRTIPFTKATVIDSLVLSDKKGYVILAPDYVSYSAGIKCLYQLCHDLNLKGYPSFIVGGSHAPETYLAPLLSEKDARAVIKAGYIAVYPEIFSGNPLSASTVARWALNKPGLLGGDAVYDDNELVFYYSNTYRDSIKNRIAGKLYMPTIDEEIFYNDDESEHPRSLECFYCGKSTYKSGYFDPKKVFEITRESPQKKDLGKLFRSSKTLYCFDNSTILTYEAILCGCPVVMIPDGTQTKADYENSELGIDGIAWWGIDEIDQTRVNVGLLKERYEKTKSDYRIQFNEFVKLTQEVASWRRSLVSERYSNNSNWLDQVGCWIMEDSAKSA